MIFNLNPYAVVGLGDRERAQMQSLINIYSSHLSKNAQKDKYYEGNISLGEVNLGIALPKGMAGLEIGCAWGAKTVDVLAARSMFDGFVGTNGYDVEALNKIVDDNDLLYEYMKACRDELKYGCTFATLSADPDIGCKIRFHSPQTAAAKWSGDKGRIECGFAVVDTAPSNVIAEAWEPKLINFYTDTDIWVLIRDGNIWNAERYPHRMGRPLMEALVWNATSSKPFGRSRIRSGDSSRAMSEHLQMRPSAWSLRQRHRNTSWVLRMISLTRSHRANSSSTSAISWQRPRIRRQERSQASDSSSRGTFLRMLRCSGS